MRRIPLLLSGLCILTACRSVNVNSELLNSETWQRINAQDLFSFMLPSSFERQKIWGIDSAVGQYRTQTVIFSYDYGPYSNDLNQSDETIKYTSRLVEIDGREAKLVLYKILRNERYKGMKFLSGVHFSRVKLEESPGPMTTELTVESLCKVQADCEAMWEVFKTIEFSE